MSASDSPTQDKPATAGNRVLMPDQDENNEKTDKH